MTKINWIHLESAEQLDSIVEKSFVRPVLIYKHSTRCGLSSIVRSRLEHRWGKEPLNVECYFLDLITHRHISNTVEEFFQVEHQSPQILLIVDGKSVFDDSHMGVNYQVVKNVIENWRAIKQ